MHAITIHMLEDGDMVIAEVTEVVAKVVMLGDLLLLSAKILKMMTPP